MKTSKKRVMRIMNKKFFSDKENDAIPQINERIPYSVFNGVIAVCNEYTIAMSSKFPVRCTDSEMIIGFDEKAFKDLMSSLIPNFKLSGYNDINNTNEHMDSDQYALLDYIEFCMENIEDYEQKYYHQFYSHYHLNFYDNGITNKSRFCDKINLIFQRNGIAFKLSENGSIERILPMGLDHVIRNCCYTGSDVELKNLIDLAVKGIIKPKIDDRQVALEKLWDAFERIKTNNVGVDKKTSVTMLIKSASEGSTEFYNLLETESKKLSEIGNKQLRIRHHETDKIKINSVKHIDYLFYRMMSLLTLLVNYI